MDALDESTGALEPAAATFTDGLGFTTTAILQRATGLKRHRTGEQCFIKKVAQTTGGVGRAREYPHALVCMGCRFL